MTSPRYNSFREWLKRRYGGRTAKISLDAGLTCPNRDGTISRRGCVFCDGRGSGTGQAGRGYDIAEQINLARPFLRQRYKTDQYIAYFQSFTNTYAPVDRLARIFAPAVEASGVMAVSIGTRPDCLPDDVLGLLADLNRRKEIWLELGLQSAHDQTLRAINRGHDFAAFKDAATRAVAVGVKVWAHLIIGLPGEGFDQVRKTIDRLAPLGLTGIKLHGLYVSKDAELAELYRAGRVELLDREAFIDLIVRLVTWLPEDWVIQRLTSDPPAYSLIAPKWMLDKQEIIRRIDARLEENDWRQGMSRQSKTVRK